MNKPSIEAIWVAIGGLLTATAIWAVSQMNAVPGLEASVKALTERVEAHDRRLHDLEIAASRDAGRRDAEQEFGRSTPPNLYRKN
jgi:hypothetical protein